MKIFALFLLSFSVVSCMHFGTSDSGRVEENLLTEKEAQRRKELVANVDYELQFDLTTESNYQGVSEIQFDLKELDDLTVDFTGGQVQEVVVNDKPSTDASYNGFFIQIPKEVLSLGRNTVVVKFTHDYSNDGMGLYRYIDVTDNKTYIYSHFEPYKANRLFPCFDQPNLKASFVTKVVAPKEWVVVTSLRETEAVEKGAVKQWFFPKSKRFSTYTYSLHAGDYKVWESTAKTKKHEIPLRLLARQSLARFVDPEEWFSLTKKAFVFFENYYSYAYPYVKYDQVIVPDFNSGAMENVAAVTFNEDRYVSKGEKTREQKLKLALVLYHEMAHMWFGNLVTMNWWDDLWLNESFATHSAYIGVQRSTDFKEAWKRFSSRKQSAYLLDMSSNTHPITTPVDSTQSAFANFDSITYGKGASVLKQLSFLLGEKTYRKALKSYFTKYASGNTTLDDFMGEMEKASGRDLSTWTQRWLKTAMMNDVEVHFTCKRDRITNFEIYQTGTKDYPTLRRHKTRLALLRRYKGVFKINRTQSVEYSGERTLVKKLIGKACPAIVYPNYKDHDYVSVTLDKNSLKHVQNSLVSVDDSSLRSILWSDLWMMTLNQKLSLDRFLEIVEYNGLGEKDPGILGKLLSFVEEGLNTYYPKQGTPWRSNREIWIKFFEQASLTKISENIVDPAMQKLWFQHLTMIAESPGILVQLNTVIKRKPSKLRLNFIVDQDLRWDIIATLARNDYGQPAEIIEKETKRDSSKRGLHKAAYAQAMIPDLEKKQELFNKVTKPEKQMSLGFTRALMYGLFPKTQENMQRKFVDSFYDSLASVSDSMGPLFARTYARALVPVFCDRKSSTRISNYLEAEKGLSVPVVKSLRTALDSNERCYRVRKVLKESNGVRAI